MAAPLVSADKQNAAAKDATQDFIRGDRYRRTHQQSVTAILGANTRPVSSRGGRFFNKDKWTGRSLVKFMCAWAKAHPGCVPTRDDVRKWVDDANNERIPNPEIVIAGTPDQLPRRVAMALTGGAYHEAFHTLYSARRNLTTDEVCDFLLARWAKVPDWNKYQKLLLEFANIIEDIRIERLGRQEFPGVEVKMYDLQDFILRQEELSRAEAVRLGQADKIGKPLSVITCTFRDVGLGYVTDASKAALTFYRSVNPDAVKLVLEGPLAPLLREAIKMPKRDDLGCIRLAMDVVAALVDAGQDESEDEQEQQQSGQGGTCTCPKCGAKGKKLVVRPKANPNGTGKVPGRGILTCTVCGWQTEVEFKEPDPNAPKPPKGKKSQGPKFEGFDEKDKQDGDGDGKGDKSKDKKGDKGKDKKKGSGGDPDDETDEDGSDSGSGGKDKKKDKKGAKSKDKGEDGSGDDDGDEDDSGSGSGEGDADGDASEESGDGDGDEGGKPSKGKSKGKGKPGDEEGDGGDEEGEGEGGGDEGDSDPQDDRQQSDGDPAHGAGGHHDSGLEHPGNDFSDLANEALEQAESGESSGAKDGSSAMEEVFADERKADDKDTKRGEAPYRPYDYSMDQIHVIEPSVRGKDYDSQQAGILCASVKTEASFLRARMRNIVKATEMTSVTHGVRRGPALAEQYLVDTRVSLMHREEPRRAFSITDEQIDVSTAAWVVLDESGSMSDILTEVTRICCAITEPLDALGCAVGVSGIRDGSYNYNYNHYGTQPEDMQTGGPYHRTNGVTHDIFMTFGEKFAAVKWRFANTQATGGTPLADGIQFGLDALSGRKEGHRILFVVTDGCPNGGHEPVVRKQIRHANDAGVHVIGVGVGSSSLSVKSLFKDWVYAETVSEMPKMLIAKMNDIVDQRTGKRGRRIKDTRA